MEYRALFFGVQGRFCRSQFWLGLVMCLFLHLAGSLGFELYAIAMRSRYGITALYWPSFCLALLLDAYVVFLMIAISIRRAHDRDRHAGYLALGVTGIAIPFLIFDLGFFRGTIGPNRFGPDPLQDTKEIMAAFDACLPAATDAARSRTVSPPPPSRRRP